MSSLRLSVCFVAAVLVNASAFAKNESLAERGQRMCEEAGVPLAECTILPPALRPDPKASLANARPVPKPTNVAATGTYGTGTYGWCENCTSLLGAAPVTPWSTFGGRQFQPIRDEDERNHTTASNSTSAGDVPGSDDGNDSDTDGGNTDGGGDPGGSDDGNDNGNGSDGGGNDNSDGGGGDQGGNNDGSGENCDPV